MAEKTQTDSKPTLAAISEERFAKDLAKALRAWRRAGKPHKR